MKPYKGFSLIEILVALAIIAIALTALIKVNGQDILHSQQLKEKNLTHLIAMQALSKIQLNLIPIRLHQEFTEKITAFDQTWYWHARSVATPIKTLQKIEITLSHDPKGPFHDLLIGFQRDPP